MTSRDFCFREKSTKTRIETWCINWSGSGKMKVLEKNPPKQGLKHGYSNIYGTSDACFREKSTKTRIETSSSGGKCSIRQQVLEKNPPKQGLKHL